MVLQQPVGCEQHAGTSPSSATAPSGRLRPDPPAARPAGGGTPSEGGPLDAEVSADPDLAALFSRAEYQRLCALRARVQEQLGRGRRPDDADPGSGRPRGADGEPR